jgi:hypothetical protein
MNIGLTNDQDLAIIDSNLSLVTGIEELRQLVKQVLLSFQGDWFLDLDLGLPYFQQILVKSTSISAVENIYLDAISSVRGILDIVSFNLDFNPKTRRADITFSALTSDGVLDFTTLGDVRNGNI